MIKWNEIEEQVRSVDADQRTEEMQEIAKDKGWNKIGCGDTRIVYDCGNNNTVVKIAKQGQINVNKHEHFAWEEAPNNLRQCLAEVKGSYANHQFILMEKLDTEDVCNEHSIEVSTCFEDNGYKPKLAVSSRANVGIDQAGDAKSLDYPELLESL